MKTSKALPKVSIVMPTYNRAAFILESIASIQRQTYSHWELIIVDDGSEDETEILVNGLQDSRIHFYKAGRIGVIIRLRCLGMEKVSGELIAFMDSDDLWAPQKLEKQVQAFENFCDAGFSLT